MAIVKGMGTPTVNLVRTPTNGCDATLKRGGLPRKINCGFLKLTMELAVLCRAITTVFGKRVENVNRV